MISGEYDIFLSSAVIQIYLFLISYYTVTRTLANFVQGEHGLLRVGENLLLDKTPSNHSLSLYYIVRLSDKMGGA